MFRIIQHFINIDNNDINDIAIYQRYSHSTQFELVVKMKIIKYTNGTRIKTFEKSNQNRY